MPQVFRYVLGGVVAVLAWGGLRTWVLDAESFDDALLILMLGVCVGVAAYGIKYVIDRQRSPARLR